MSEWQTIDTFPRTGEWALVRIPGFSVPAVMRPIGPGSDEWEDFWRGADFEFASADRPTHWMQCPEWPPKKPQD